MVDWLIDRLAIACRTNRHRIGPINKQYKEHTKHQNANRERKRQKATENTQDAACKSYPTNQPIDTTPILLVDSSIDPCTVPPPRRRSRQRRVWALVVGAALPTAVVFIIHHAMMEFVDDNVSRIEPPPQRQQHRRGGWWRCVLLLVISSKRSSLKKSIQTTTSTNGRPKQRAYQPHTHGPSTTNEMDQGAIKGVGCTGKKNNSYPHSNTYRLLHVPLLPE